MLTTAVLTPAQRVERLTELRRLLSQLTPSVVDVPDAALAERLSDERLIMVVVQDDDQLVGTATLAVFPTAGLGLVGHVDDVVVDESARGAGVGRLLMAAAHDEARRQGLRHLDLTSRPAREAANALYRSLGYELRPTNPYRLRL